MILNANTSIAVKNSYDRYDIEFFSLFELSKVNETFTFLKIKVQNNKEILIKISCPLCGNYHYYRYTINEFLKRKLSIGGCEVLGVPLFYIGDKDEVSKKVNKHNGIGKRICATI